MAPQLLSSLPKHRQLDVRASQRTYQGAYLRTALGVLAFSVLAMRLFAPSFAAIGLVFQLYALALCALGWLRGRHDHPGDYFVTVGNYVLALSTVTCACFAVLLVLLARI